MKRRDLVRSSSPTSVYEELLCLWRIGDVHLAQLSFRSLKRWLCKHLFHRLIDSERSCHVINVHFFFFLISFLNLKNRMDHLDPLVDLHNKYQRPWLLLRAHLPLHVLFISSSSAFTHTLISLAKVLLGPSSVHLLGTICTAASKTCSSLSFCPIQRTPPRHVSPPFKPASFHF